MTNCSRSNKSNRIVQILMGWYSNVLTKRLKGYYLQLSYIIEVEKLNGHCKIFPNLFDITNVIV